MLRFARALIPILYAAATFYATGMGFFEPYRNWDMLGYAGSVIAWQGHGPAETYRETLTAAKATIPDWIYAQYTENPLSAEPRAFAQQLRFYQVKPLYTGLIWLLHQSSLPLTTASWWISASSFLLLALLLLRWRTGSLPHDVWLLLVLGLTFLGDWPMASLARFSTPDALCTLLSLGGLYAWLSRRSFRTFCLLSWLALLARPDAIIFGAAMAICFSTLAPKPLRVPLARTAGFIVVMLATGFSVSHFADSYSWERMFIQAFINRTAYPADATDSLSFAQYLHTLRANAYLFFASPRMLMLSALALAGGAGFFLKRAEGSNLALALLATTWLALAVRFAIFPACCEERYYYAYWLMMLYASGELAAPWLRERRNVFRCETAAKTLKPLNPW